MGFLEISAADFLRGNMGGNRKDGHAASMSIVKTINEVQVSGTTASRADGQFSGQSCLCAGGERCGFLVADTNPADPFPASYRIGDPVERIASDTVDSLYARCRKNLHE